MKNGFIIFNVVVTSNEIEAVYTCALFCLSFRRKNLGKTCHQSAVVNGFFHFRFHINRQGALADGLHGLNPKNTAPRHTPRQKATSVGLATGKALGNSGGKLGLMYKRINPSGALGGFCVYNNLSLGEGRKEVSLIHPRKTIV